ncbi:hypothetical protein SLA2020_499460 [Shorea laevis]
MSVHYKLEAYVPINAPADKYYNVFKNRPHHLPNISTERLQNCQLHGGGSWDAHGHGSIKTWTYTIGGKANQSFKERVEFDDATKTITLIGLEGDVFKEFKLYNVIYQPIPKDSNSCVVKSVIEYEKLRDDGPDAHRYLDFIVGIAKDVEAHLVKA